MTAGLLRGAGEASLSAAVMILAVLILRLRFQDRTPRRVFCLLWDLALVRLLAPVALPSPVSIRRWLPGLAKEAAVLRDAPAQTAAITEVGLVSKSQWLPRGSAVEEAVQLVQVGTASPSPDWGAMLAALWLAVALLLAMGFLWSHLRGRRIYAASLPCREDFVLDWLADHPLRRPIQVRTCARISAPLTYGVLYPMILLPCGMDWGDRAALSCVLAHEREHVRRFDALRKLFLAAALCLHWYNPLVWVLYVLANRDMEMACDEAVLRGGADREGYALALLGLEERRGRWSPSGSHFSGNALEERIREIMKRKHISLTALLAVLVVMSIATTVLASAAPEDGARENGLALSGGEVVLFTGGGEELYSEDGGKTWANMEQYHAKHGSWGDGWQVEWWTYEEYKDWLEEEKRNLQEMVGSQGYTGSTGWFTWDQRRVDETVALYEGILEEIKNGALYSKTIRDKNGREVEDTALGAGGTVVASVFDAIVTGNNSDDFAALLEEAKAFGVTEEADKLYYKGQLVRTLVDGRKVDGGYTYGSIYGNYNGVIDLQTQRAASGGQESAGALTGLLSERDVGFDQGMLDLLGMEEKAWRTYGSLAPENGDAVEAAFAPYEKYGLVYLPRECGIGSMTYFGQPVRSFTDRQSGGGVFSYEDPNVEAGLAVYTQYDREGQLVGLAAE